jgi:hypothetical protein
MAQGEVYDLPSLDDYLKDSGTDYGDWVRQMFDLFVDEYYGPEFDTGDRQHTPEEAAQMKELLDRLEAGEAVDLSEIQENYPQFYDYLSSNYDLDTTTATPQYAEGDQMSWEDMTEEERNAHAVRRYERTGETNPWYDNMTQEEIDAAYEYLKTDGDPAIYGTQEGYNYVWENNKDYIVEQCESDAGCNADMQAWYDRWVSSGRPTTKEGMISPEDYEKRQREITSEAELREVLAEIGYNEYEINDLMETIQRGEFYGSLVISTILYDEGYWTAGSDWSVNPSSGTPCTAEDGSIGEYVFGGECVSKGVGNVGDPCGYKQEGKKDESGNCIGGADDCSNPTYAADFPDRCKEPDPEQELVDQYGQSAVDKAKEIYEGIKDTIQGAIDDPQGTLISILDNVYPQMSEECQNEGTVGVDIPSDWWKDCVTIGVLLPGLNIPLPPGMIDVNTTIRDLENAANEVGKTLEDIFNGEDDRSISEILGDWASDVWEGIKDAWEDLEDKTDAGLLNILIDMGYSILGPLIFSQIKETIIGNTNPLAFVQNCYDSEWRGQSPENQAFCNEALDQGALIRCADGSYRETQAECAEGEFGFCEDGTTQKTDAEGKNCEEWGGEFGWCTDKREKRKEDAEGTNCDGYVAPFDCSSVGREEPAGGEKATSADDCGACLNPDFEIQEAGQCADPNALTEKEQECADKGLKYDDLNDECYDECVDPKKTPTGPNGECVDPPWTNPADAPTEQDCTSRGKTFIPADEANQKPSECGECTTEGFVHDGVGTNCYDPNPEPEPCPGNQQRFDGEKCEEPCEFDNTISVSDPACKDPNTGNDPQAGDPCDSTGDGVKDGTLQANESGELECVAGPGPEPEGCDNNATLDSECTQCQDGSLPSEHIDGDCSKGLVLVQVECPEGTPKAGQMVNDLSECGTLAPPPDPCDDPVYAADNPLECGGDPECNDCTCAEYAAQNPLECGETPLDCDDPAYAAANPDICGTTPNPCDDAVYASENPLECGWVECPDGSFAPTQEQCGGGGCPEGQEPCEALGGECTTPENCPGGDSGGIGGGGGGGGAGMFEPFTTGISGDPQLLTRKEFPITDYLAGLFKGIV